MKKIKSLGIITMIFTFTVVLISCETEENLQEINNEEIDANIITEAIEALEASENEPEITPDTKTTGKASGAVDERVYRYYQGGATSVHTYKTQSGSGYALGRREGIAFVTPVSTTSTGVDRNTYNFLWFLLHPNLKDFVMTTSNREFWDLRRQGWKNVTYRYILIQKGPGNGTKKLYRFYDEANSDHLYTKNYSEGINAGLKYEGVVGWVK